MSIAEVLKAKKAQQESKPRGDGISEAVLISALTRAGCDQITINDCLAESTENWAFFITYFERKQNENV